MTANVLMLSSSRVADSLYLAQPKAFILDHLEHTRDVLFVPFAGVGFSWDEYLKRVQTALPELSISSIHHANDMHQAIKDASSIMVGGGNTFNLLATLYEHDLVEAIKQQVMQSTPYVGWSAGSNLCGLSIKTTNDMPIVQPKSFDSFGFINAQINPHYTDAVPAGHNGETRDQRIAEFCALCPDVPVVGIREGSALLLKNNKLGLLGNLDGVKFLATKKHVVAVGSDLSSLLA